MKSGIGIYQFLIINLGAAISAIGTVFIKKVSTQLAGTPDLPSAILTTLASPYFWMGGICYIVPIGFWVYLLREMDMTQLQPMLSVVYIYTLVLGMFFLGEAPNAIRLFGIGVVMIGVILVGLSS